MFVWGEGLTDGMMVRREESQGSAYCIDHYKSGIAIGSGTGAKKGFRGEGQDQAPIMEEGGEGAGFALELQPCPRPLRLLYGCMPDIMGTALSSA